MFFFFFLYFFPLSLRVMYDRKGGGGGGGGSFDNVNTGTVQCKRLFIQTVKVTRALA